MSQDKPVLSREEYLERFDNAVRAADLWAARSIMQAIIAIDREQINEPPQGSVEIAGPDPVAAPEAPASGSSDEWKGG